MFWPNVKLIFQRETRDQLRDRRTLFTIAVLPLVLYPLMGMAMLQVAQFTREHPTRIWMLGAEHLLDVDGQSSSLALFADDNTFDPQWLGNEKSKMLEFEPPLASDEKILELIVKAQTEKSVPADLVNEYIDREMKARGVDLAVLCIPNTDSNRDPNTDEGRDNDSDHGGSDHGGSDHGGSDHGGSQANPSILVVHNSANDRSVVAANRIKRVLVRWQNESVRASLVEKGIPDSVIQGVSIKSHDIAARANVQAATWSKILPFIVIIWSLTGAFYPAIDLCAGEKERGTFETLLSSPAGRTEIAIGKLLTVMSFSMVTSLLNLGSMAFTGLFVASRMGGMGGLAGLGMPPISSLAWLVLALIPISALFSAVALAAAAFARSSKEGQYYLIPLMMITMPLMMLPMLPGTSLDMGTSLIPVSGLMLLLRGLIEGQYAEVLPYVAPVCMVTLICCYLAIRWVVRQFNSESVLFRASEKFAIGLWLQQVMRDRDERPTVGNACLLGVLILILGFFVQLAASGGVPSTWGELVKMIMVVLVATVGVPAVLLAAFLTRSPLKSLRLNPFTIPAACAAVLMAICFHPLVTWFSGLVLYLYPLPDGIIGKADFMTNLVDQAPGLWAIILLLAVAPAVFEELAFRGFILSGFEKLKNRWQAILVTSLLFGIAHFSIQQSIITFAVGMILGLIAIETRSLIPCILYHATHNAITVTLPRIDAATVEGSPLLSRILYSSDGSIYQYSILPGVAMTLMGILLVLWFLKGRSSVERQQQGSFQTFQKTATKH